VLTDAAHYAHISRDGPADGSGGPIMMNHRIAAAILGVALVVAPTIGRAGSFADQTCNAFRRELPVLQAKIAVTCEWPTKTTYFECGHPDRAVTERMDMKVTHPSCATAFSQKSGT
jgi:hypothetical protein